MVMKTVKPASDNKNLFNQYPTAIDIGSSLLSGLLVTLVPKSWVNTPFSKTGVAFATFLNTTLLGLGNKLGKTDKSRSPLYRNAISVVSLAASSFAAHYVVPHLPQEFEVVLSTNSALYIAGFTLVAKVTIYVLYTLGIGSTYFSQPNRPNDSSNPPTPNGRPQDVSLEMISKMTEESMSELCKSIKVNNRNDYIKCMLIFAIKAEKVYQGFVDVTFHDMVPYFQENNESGELKQFVHEDITVGRNNQKDTLLHEILKCKFLSSKAKGSAFGFILRDGHDYLRDYLGNRTLGEENQWGNRPRTFPVVKWGDSLKEIFDTFSPEQKKEFFENSNDIADRLNSFTGIVKA